MVDFKLSVLDELTPGEAVLLEHFRALPLDDRRTLLNVLDRAAADAAAGMRPLAFLYRDAPRPSAAIEPARDRRHP